MKVIFETRDPEAVEFRGLAVRRIRLALRRLKWLAPRTRVHLCDINGPRGGVDKRCRIEVVTDSTRPVVITAIARDWRSALHIAVARVAQTLLHNWQRTRDIRRARRPPLALDS